MCPCSPLLVSSEDATSKLLPQSATPLWPARPNWPGPWPIITITPMGCNMRIECSPFHSCSTVARGLIKSSALQVEGAMLWPRACSPSQRTTLLWHQSSLCPSSISFATMTSEWQKCLNSMPLLGKKSLEVLMVFIYI